MTDAKAVPTPHNGTQLDPFDHTAQVDPPFAPRRQYAPDETPEFRVWPIVGWVPDFDIDHSGVGNTLQHYIGHEEVPDANIEYRSGEKGLCVPEVGVTDSRV